jgi:tRNA threonylcarbamoyladenosine biosynthesis protein TsaE
MQFISNSEKETRSFGKHLAQALKAGDIIGLFGELGTGKTTLVKGIAQGLKVKRPSVHSPTFTLMNIYEGRLPLFHFDLYRLDDEKEIDRIGCNEFFYDAGVSVIEWAEKLGHLLPKEYLHIELKHKQDNQRILKISPRGERYRKIAGKLVVQ